VVELGPRLKSGFGSGDQPLIQRGEAAFAAQVTYRGFLFPVACRALRPETYPMASLGVRTGFPGTGSLQSRTGRAASGAATAATRLLLVDGHAGRSTRAVPCRDGATPGSCAGRRDDRVGSKPENKAEQNHPGGQFLHRHPAGDRQ
jgi:hypothetical protein